jgi:RimJ/RimL family protein N-acetyltransferase
MIRSARLQLSPFTIADAEEVFECITPSVARFMRWDPPKSLKEYKTHREPRLKANDRLVFSFVVRPSDTMECLGIAGLDEADQPTPGLGIWLKEAAHGHGYGTDSAAYAICHQSEFFHGKASQLDLAFTPEQRRILAYLFVEAQGGGSTAATEADGYALSTSRGLATGGEGIARVIRRPSPLPDGSCLADGT